MESTTDWSIQMTSAWFFLSIHDNRNREEDGSLCLLIGSHGVARDADLIHLTREVGCLLTSSSDFIAKTAALEAISTLPLSGHKTTQKKPLSWGWKCFLKTISVLVRSVLIPY